ncbi:MAG: ferrous iron transport protein A [Acidobacteria bacterium]|nr:ferrous iron transport protein A [Acidobacteriota bacterium]
MTLSKVESGNEVTLKSINGGRHLKAKLYSMGLVPGTRLYILSRENRGRVLVRARDGNFALGYGMAEKINVE